ncbi:MAG: RHS repeat-associated core domain-containing protein [Lentisphaerae bacterium]|nr:RHS repeat-associated core domain-containing protein [Lentisphaerota bacterium]
MTAFGSISNSTFTTSYLYYPDSTSAGWTTALTNGTIVSSMTTCDPYRGLVMAVSNTVNDVLVSAYLYNHDALGCVVSRNDDIFGYNPFSELTSAAIGSNVCHYAYDGIGNAQWTDINGILTLYHTNPLNQYTNILRTTSPPCELEYDLDGNLLNLPSPSGRGGGGEGWLCQWNGENRLIVASNDTAQVAYAYDHRGRMVNKTISPASAAAEKVISYLWDDYNSIAETVVQGGVTSVTYNVWGLDISGTMQGAGGIGGLLLVVRDGEPFIPCYNANGNITEYLDTNGVVVAHYGYDPFGNIIIESGSLANAFTHRFSTKPWCEVTGLSEYVYRKYLPPMGRWLSRDPIGEKGGMNINAFVGNEPLARNDKLGLIFGFLKGCCTTTIRGQRSYGITISLSPDNRYSPLNMFLCPRICLLLN